MVDILSAIDQLRRTGAEFLKIDLATALTFAEIARTSTEPERRERNRRNAARAYRGVSELLRRANLTPDEAEEIAKLTAELKQKLQTLGEPV